jgi:hypothetical protein
MERDDLEDLWCLFSRETIICVSLVCRQKKRMGARNEETKVEGKWLECIVTTSYPREQEKCPA